MLCYVMLGQLDDAKRRKKRGWPNSLNKSKYLLIRRQKTKPGRGKLYANRTIYGSSVAVIYIRRSYEGKG